MPTHRERANAIRALAMDSVQKANSGHPGMPMGMADIAEVLWNEFFKHNPNDPQWSDRDRFVLSNGHGCMLQYALLHLAGYDVSMDDLKQFRQWGSKTPGHPEYGHTPGVEITTGPLGQGLAAAVGMAIAERNLAVRYNRPEHHVVDHFTYVFAGEGCLMEGISHEACSLAGTWGLGKLIVFFDDNGISIDGDVKGWFTDDTPKRFAAYQWQVIEDVDGHDAEAIRNAIKQARQETAKPTLICCKTQIGFGAPNLAGSAKSHGAPLGEEEIAKTKAVLNWSHDPFVIPDDITASWDAREAGQQYQSEWQTRFQRYQQAYPEQAVEFARRVAGELPSEWQTDSDKVIQQIQAAQESSASRKASQQALNHFGPLLPELIGGSADLSGSNLTLWGGCKPVSRETADGNYVYYGVREFAMTAISNGLSAHGGFIPYSGTFLVFSDYARNAVRLSAMMRLRNILVYTHDSIGLGEDGPTHQPIEHAAMLRMTPNLNVWRPADATETAVAWQQAITRNKGPSALLLSRQGLPAQERTAEQVKNIAKGAYVLIEPEQSAEIIFIATGSEVQLAVSAANTLNQQGKAVRVVAMPCAELFLAQPEVYQQQVLPESIQKRIAIEAASSDYWHRFVGHKGQVLGIDRFGASAPAGELFKQFGFTEQHLIQITETL